ncbi:MAG: sulfatase [Rubripirellula sp.]
MRIATRLPRALVCALILLVLPNGSWAMETQEKTQEVQTCNVLFIAVDDLRPQLACYGESQMHTPNFDALSRRSVLFERAYCMVPTCGASRASLMTGIRPSPKRFVSYTARADQETPDATTLNTLFKQNGYTTISLGKVFHFTNDSAGGWSKMPWRSQRSDYQNMNLQSSAITRHRQKYPKRKKVRGMPYESAEAADHDYRDHETASKAIDYLKQFSNTGEPFFLAIGFNKPHLPFCAPKRFWDLYPDHVIQLPENDVSPKDVPEGAVHGSGELRAYATIPPSGPVSKDTARSLIHGYYACVSFVDAQLGRILAELDQSGLSESTIVVLWGDHGWQLGEHGMWNKHSCFETSMHSPLMIAAPGYARGARCESLTEFIDIYPTLCALTNLKTPGHVQGVSLTPWLKDPSLPGKVSAVGRFQKGDTIRTDFYRYSEYRDQNGAGSVSGAMLYDHRRDPREDENLSGVVGQEQNEASLSSELSLRKGRD